MRKIGSFRAGTSGFQYDHWAGVFYPEDLPKARWLDHYVQHFDTIEINSTFYSLPAEKTFDTWRAKAPEGFCYVLKFSRYGTHIKKLNDPHDSIGHFLERARRLGPLLGPILVQLPPRFNINRQRLADFLDAAPSDRRWAFEFRDKSWLCDDIFELLQEHEAALCVHDMIRGHPEVITADWTYRRYHGADTWGDYPHQALMAQADKIRQQLGEGLDVYAYFNNDAHGYAVANARDLKRYVQGS